jgi:hypothetical protein
MGGRTIYRTLSPERHLFTLGLTGDSTCERCLEEDESVTHILRDCEVIYYLIFRHLGQFFVELLLWHPHKRSHTFHSKRGISKGLIKRGSRIDRWWSRRKGRIVMTHPSYIQSCWEKLSRPISSCNSGISLEGLGKSLKDSNLDVRPADRI